MDKKISIYIGNYPIECPWYEEMFVPQTIKTNGVNASTLIEMAEKIEEDKSIRWWWLKEDFICYVTESDISKSVDGILIMPDLSFFDFVSPEQLEDIDIYCVNLPLKEGFVNFVENKLYSVTESYPDSPFVIVAKQYDSFLRKLNSIKRNFFVKDINRKTFFDIFEKK